MADNTMGITLQGDVTLVEYAQIMDQFSILVGALTDEILGEDPENPVEWRITRLAVGSAIAEITAEHSDPDAIGRVVDAYSVIGQRLQERAPIPYSEVVVQSAQRMTHVLNGRIVGIQFWTPQAQSLILEPVGTQEERPLMRTFIGTVKGVVGGVYVRSHRGRKPTMMLYDSLFDQAVTCILTAEQLNEMKNALGQRVMVTGLLRRESVTGKPISVEEVFTIDPFPESAKDSYKQVAGILPWKKGDEPSDITLRRWRDAE